jgi:hypothetical protein
MTLRCPEYLKEVSRYLSSVINGMPNRPVLFNEYVRN